MLRISEKDGHYVLKLDNVDKPYDIKPYLNFWDQIDDFKHKPSESYKVFLTGYTAQNLDISKKCKILGWKKQPKGLTLGDYVFVYNKDTKRIECGFQIKSISNNVNSLWLEERDRGSQNLVYKVRWDADLICDALDIDHKQVEPFKSNKKLKFHILVAGDSPNSLSKQIYKPFRDYLLSHCNLTSNITETKWQFDLKRAIDDILAVDTKDELAIERAIIERILLHLKAGEHVILVGPPGVGKTDLARRILRKVGNSILGYPFLESVASDEWSRYEVIGGIKIDGEFQKGCVTKAARSKSWLLIDEFNRANMNKAFGEMFLAIEYHEITLRSGEIAENHNVPTVEIPQDFRMICTMNDFDKNLLLTELSYGLINRFTFVSITPDKEREKIAVKNRINAQLGNEEIYEKCIDQIKVYYNFIKCHFIKCVKCHSELGQTDCDTKPTTYTFWQL